MDVRSREVVEAAVLVVVLVVLLVDLIASAVPQH